MPYGTIKVDTITFTSAGVDTSISVSGLAQNPTFTGSISTTGTVSGNLVVGGQGNFTSISGGTISGTSATYTTISGGTFILTSGVFASGTAAAPSITFTGDLNTGFYSPGADQVAISTGGSGRLFIDSSGRVGIGTSTVNAKLHVKGADGDQAILDNAGEQFTQMSIRNNGTQKASIFYDNTNAVFNLYSEGATRFDVNGSEKARLTSTGLGIGTQSPGDTLHVEGNIYLGTTARTVYQGGSANLILQTNTGNILFSRSNGSAESARIDSSGNFGIGASGNLSKLTVGTGNNLSASALVAFNTANANINALTLSNWTGTAATQGPRIAFDNSGVGGWTIGSADGVDAFDFCKTWGTPAVRIDSSSRLLVGTSSSPTTGQGQYARIVAQGYNGDATGGGIISIQRGSAATGSGSAIGEICFGDNTGATFAKIGCDADATVSSASDLPGRLTFSTTADGASSPTERMRISSSGVVTIQNGSAAAIATLTDGATITSDFSSSTNFVVTLNGNRGMANPINVTAGQSGAIFIIQGTGSNTLTWSGNWDWPNGGAPTLSTTSGAVDRVDYICRSATSIHAVYTGSYS